MAKPRLVRKRCTKCGHVAMVKPRVRRCHEYANSFRAFACWGALERAPIKRTPKPKPSKIEQLNAELLKTRRHLAKAVTRQKKAAKAVTRYARQITKLLNALDATRLRGIRVREDVSHDGLSGDALRAGGTEERAGQ